MTTAPAAPAMPVLEGAEAPAPRKRSLLVPLIAGAVLAGALGAGVWFFVVPKVSAPAAKAVPEAPAVKATVSLGAVVVNLKGEARRYLRVSVSLGLPSSKDVHEIEDHKSQLLDLLISHFSAAEIETLTSEEGKTALKDELLELMHDALHLKKVIRVYFTEFVIQ